MRAFPVGLLTSTVYRNKHPLPCTINTQTLARDVFMGARRGSWLRYTRFTACKDNCKWIYSVWGLSTVLIRTYFSSKRGRFFFAGNFVIRVVSASIFSGGFFWVSCFFRRIFCRWIFLCPVDFFRRIFSAVLRLPEKSSELLSMSDP